VHPTKQEIKFEDEKIVYAFVQAAVKHALAQFSVAPSLDFTLNAEIQSLDAVNKPFTTDKKDAVASSNLYSSFTKKHQAHFIEPSAQKSELRHWKDFFQPDTAASVGDALLEHEKRSITTTTATDETPAHQTFTSVLAQSTTTAYTQFLQLHNTYIITPTQSGFVLVHQQLAHERVLYDRYSARVHNKQAVTQKILFPSTLELAAADTALLHDLLPDIAALGYEIEPFGNNTFVIQGTPADVKPGNENHSVELLLEQFKHFTSEVKFSKREKLVRCMSRQHAIKAGQTLSQQEMQMLIEELFACQSPNVTPTGSPTYLEFKEDYLDRMFGR
jgi:DNA mismatch repair protein MutL